MEKLVAEPGADNPEISRHLATCAQCRQEETMMMDLHLRLMRDSQSVTEVNMVERTMERIGRVKVEQPSAVGKIFRWKRLASVAAVIVLGTILAWQWPQSARAAEVLEKGAKAAHTAATMHIKARMRTPPRDNFEQIGLNIDFVQIDLWRRGEGNKLQWRVEKSGRIAVMDGTTAYMLLKPHEKEEGGGWGIKGPPEAGFVGWLRGLLDVEDVLQSEIKLARKQGSTLTLTQEQAADGRKISVVTVEAKAQGDYTNDWTKNTSISDSDNRRVYRFEASSHRLVSMQIWVHQIPGNDVLIFEATQIEYPAELPASLFAIELPRGVEWQEVTAMRPFAANTSAPAAVAADKKPEEIARGFFDALIRGDAEAVNTYFGMKMNIPMLGALREKKLTLTVVSIGKAFPSGQYPGWFVPYEIEFSDGARKQTKKHNLAVRNDNPTKTWTVDGGF